LGAIAIAVDATSVYWATDTTTGIGGVDSHLCGDRGW
jgi:hypothetical protein